MNIDIATEFKNGSFGIVASRGMDGNSGGGWMFKWQTTNETANETRWCLSFDTASTTFCSTSLVEKGVWTYVCASFAVGGTKYAFALNDVVDESNKPSTRLLVNTVDPLQIGKV